MTHYSNDAADVRVDFWKVCENGDMEWCYTKQVCWTGGWLDIISIHDAFKESLLEHFKGESRMAGLLAICNEPYREHSYPIAILIPEKV